MEFQALAKRISPTLRRITYKLNGHFSFFDDEDLFQEAILHLWQDFQKGKIEGKTDSYILQGCWFHLKNYIRTARTKPNVVSIEAIAAEGGLDLVEALCGDEPEAYLDDLERKLALEDLQNNAVTEREKTVLAGCLEGMTTRQIGRRLGVSHVTVVKIKKRIKKKYIKLFSLQ